MEVFAAEDVALEFLTPEVVASEVGAPEVVASEVVISFETEIESTWVEGFRISVEGFGTPPEMTLETSSEID